MRILHTGDWHMGHRLGEVCRANDILKNVRRVAEYLEEYSVDVLIIAGDLFCDRLTRDGLKEAIGNIEQIFVPFLRRGGTILAVRGNHDNDSFCESLNSAFNLIPDGVDKGGVSPPGRFHLANTAKIVRLHDHKTDAVHPFVLMPYPGASWLRDLPFEEIGRENAHKAQRVSRFMAERVRPAVEKDAAAILVSHILVRGVTTRNGYKLSENEDVVFEQSDVPTYWAYGAFGHIHKPQEVVHNAPWMRYCGSVESLDAGERDDEKSVTLVEINRAGRVKDPQLLRLPSSPFLMTEINDHAKDLDRIEREWGDRPRSELEAVLVKATIHYLPGQDDYVAAQRRLSTLFPRLYQTDARAKSGSGEVQIEEIFGQQDSGDAQQIAREYLQRKLDTTDPRRERLLLMLEELFTSEESLL